jgi:hypothetical protein
LGCQRFRNFRSLHFLLGSRPGDKQTRASLAASVTFVSLNAAIHRAAWIALNVRFSAHRFCDELARLISKYRTFNAIFFSHDRLFGSNNTHVISYFLSGPEKKDSRSCAFAPSAEHILPQYTADHQKYFKLLLKNQVNSRDLCKNLTFVCLPSSI